MNSFADAVSSTRSVGFCGTGRTAATADTTPIGLDAAVGPSRGLPELPERDAVDGAVAVPQQRDVDRRARAAAGDVGDQRQALIAGGQGDRGRQAGHRVDQHGCAAGRHQRREAQAAVGADEGDVLGTPPTSVRLTLGRKPVVPGSGSSVSVMTLGIVLQAHADARVVVFRRIAVVDRDRGGHQVAVVGPAGERDGDSLSGSCRSRIEQVLVRFDDQQPAGAAGQRERAA